MWYADGVQNAQLAIDCFESVLKNSQDREVLIRASNGKSQGWWWKILSKGGQVLHQENEEPLFYTWAKSIALTYRNDATAISYYALSHLLTSGSINEEELVWFQAAWTFLRLNHQTPPPGFLYFYFSFLNEPQAIRGVLNVEIRDLPSVLSSLEPFRLFVETVTLKDLYTIQRCVINPFS
jgi:hypothetical protein